MQKALHIIILAAGAGTRMKSRVPKVLQTIGGQPMIIHVLDTAVQLNPAGIHVVSNPRAPEVREVCADFDITWATQAEQLGTGHAVMQAMPAIPDDSRVLVLYGDTPLIEAGTISHLADATSDSINVLTMHVQNPRGYGRILRDAEGHVTAIVEERDASTTQKQIREVNSGIVLAHGDALRSCLQSLASNNDQNEFYLTDIFSIAHARGISTGAIVAPDTDQLEGVNDRIQLAVLERRYQMKKAAELMAAGVQLSDPARLDIRGNVQCGSDVYIDVNAVLSGDIVLGDGVQIGPGCVLTDCRLAAGTKVHANSVLEGMSTLGACEIGPFARVRPGTRLEAGSKVGNFVEIKNTRLGKNSKASHLSYLGDSEVGDRVNIGAGTITCNYDGANKHTTIIEDDVFVGSDTQLVAPVTVGEGANIGAGTTLTKNAPAGKLTLSRAKQVTIPGWKRPVKE